MFKALEEGMRLKGCAPVLKMFVFLFAALLMLHFDANHIYGYTAVKGTVLVKSGKVRKDANTNSSFVFGVTKDETVTVIGEKTGKDGQLWYEIQVMNTTGYIRSDLISKTKTIVKDSSKTTEKENSDKKNDNKTDTSDTLKNSSSETIKIEEAKQGEKVVASGNASVKGTNVIVREGASTNSGIRIMVQKGQIVTIMSNETGTDGKLWYNVSFSKDGSFYKGYIRSDLVETGAKVDATQTEDANSVQSENAKEFNEENSNDVNNIQIGNVRGNGVNIRKEPVTGKVVCRLNAGDVVTVTEQVRAKDDMNIWLRISFMYEGKALTGFIRSDFVNNVKLHVPGEPIDEEKKEEPEEENKEEKKEEVTEETVIPESGSSSSVAIKGTGVRIRKEAVNGDIIAQLDTGYPVEIIGETNGSDNHTWYKIAFSKNDKRKEGYVRSDLVTISVSNYTAELSDGEFEEKIKEFPDTYKNYLRALHEKYPNWIFKPVRTNLDWSDVVKAECIVGKNLVAKNSIASWKSTAPQAYNETTNTWYGFDGGSWAAASPELIKYYLDPRNFLNDSGIFQFETLGYEEYQNVEGVNNIIRGSFMDTRFVDTDGAERSYADIFMEAGRAYNISPYHLASRVLQEQGTSGTSQSISGKVSGLGNIFNYFNIGAYAANGRTATINGLYYAAGVDENNIRPWNSRYRAILGGAKHITDKYISVGQNTLYFEKFNVVNTTNGIYAHQYMSNVVAASAESARLRKAYTDPNTTLVFRIPFYNNMPAALCQKPTSDSNPNTYLSELAIEGHPFTTTFSAINNTYYALVDSSVESVNILAKPVSASSVVGGTGTVRLDSQTTTVTIVCKAQNGSTKNYTVIIQKKQ